MNATIEKTAPKAPPAWASETFEAACHQIRGFAEKDFAQHVLTETGPNEWRCGRPNSGFYSFRVIVRPGCVIVYGDIGEGIFRGGEAGDMLGWLRGATGKGGYPLTYLMEKVRPARKAFYAGDALEYARDAASDGSRGWKELYREARCRYTCLEFHEHAWSELLQEHAPESDAWSVAFHPSGEVIWLCEALRWFCAHLPAEAGKDGG